MKSLSHVKTAVVEGCVVSSSAEIMSVMSPGGRRCWRILSGVFLLFLASARTGHGARSIVIEISDISQPYNCSAFFDNLEVSVRVNLCQQINMFGLNKNG